MIKVTRTVTLDGQNQDEYNKIIVHFEQTNPESQGWKLLKEPILNRVTAVKTEEVQTL